MARAAKLKVYRTPIGFHDAYVAAPSQKAALDAWGSTHDLFARGIAEIVTDEALTKEPLEHPGTVIKRSRGTTAEQIAALPSPTPPAAKSHSSGTSDPISPTKRVRKPTPKPSHDAVDAAEGELAEIKNRHTEADRVLAVEQAELDRRRSELKKEHKAKLAKAQDALDKAENSYEAAIRKWRG